MDKEAKIKAMEFFIEYHTKRQIAEFVVNLDEAVKGLGENNRALAEAYREALSSSHNNQKKESE